MSFDEDLPELRRIAAEEVIRGPVAYAEAVLSKPSHLVCELHEAPTGVLTTVIEQVVTVEGPVHIDEIIARIRDAWGLKRAGTRIQEAVRRV